MNLSHNIPRTALLAEMCGGQARRAAQYLIVRASGVTQPPRISAATRWDRAILPHGFVAARSCSAGYTTLTAPRPGTKSPTVAAVGYYEIGSYHSVGIWRL